MQLHHYQDEAPRLGREEQESSSLDEKTDWCSGALEQTRQKDGKLVQVVLEVLFTGLYHQTGGWVAEFVRCVNGDEILQDWAKALNEKARTEWKASEHAQSEEAPVEIKKVRPHVLKVDVEGHDYEVCGSEIKQLNVFIHLQQVLMGFLHDETPNSELPLLINFEAKSLYERFEFAKKHMERR